MTTRKDEMTIVVSLAPPKTAHGPQVRAQEERQTDVTKRKKKRLLGRLGRLRAARASSRLFAVRLGGSRGGGLGRMAARAGGLWLGGRILAGVGLKLIPIVGWAFFAVDLVMLGHELARRIEGDKSERLVKLEDREVLYDGLDLEAAANAAGLAYLEGDAAWLRSYAREGQVASSIMENAKFIKQRTLETLKGRRMIELEVGFDSADTLVDKMIAAWMDPDLKHLADSTIEKMRAHGYGRIRSVR